MDQGCIPNIHSSDTAIFMHNEFYTNCASCLTATSEVSDISGFLGGHIGRHIGFGGNG